MIDTIKNMDCLDGLRMMKDESIDSCITSPPYWGLRDYEDGDQLGNEPEFGQFLDNLRNVFSEVQRVLKPTGTCFVNLGDTYGGSGSGTTKNADVSKYVKDSKQVYALPNRSARASKFRGTPLNKSLLMIPERFSLQMIDNGWVLRNQIIWHKPNQMPSSANDRFTVDYEKIFFFTKKAKDYHFEQQFEKSIWSEKDKRSVTGSTVGTKVSKGEYAASGSGMYKGDTKNMRTVWSENTVGFGDGHFATFPEKLVARMVKAGCPEGGLILDPFMGAGTTAVVSRKLGRHYVGFELNKKYIEMANNRIHKEVGSLF